MNSPWNRSRYAVATIRSTPKRASRRNASAHAIVPTTAMSAARRDRSAQPPSTASTSDGTKVGTNARASTDAPVNVSPPPAVSRVVP
jgi:hypothetical protein